MNKDNLPQHIAIIPDGNRRWAKQRSLKPWDGHFKGAENTEDLLRTALDLGISCFSFWGGSLNNLTKRPKREIHFLFKMYDKYFNKILNDKEIHQKKVKVNVIGRWEEIAPKYLLKTIRKVIKETKDYNDNILNVFIAYNGTDEMLEAVKSIVREGRKNKGLKTDSNLIEKHLWTGGLPPVDLLIRTGSNNDPHNSVGFMMWHCANSQLYFAKEYYPDFGKKELIKAIKDFQKRERRRGK